ncbi:MAG: glycosyltransferase family 4 protein [Propionibacteriaceae bacterium]
MKILHVSDTYLPKTGGIELHVADLAARQRATGHQVSVATSSEASHAAPEVIRVPGSAVFPTSAHASLSQLIEAGRFDVVHAHSSVISPLSWSAVRAGSRLGVPTVFTLHSMLPTGVTGNLLSHVVPAVPDGVVWTAVSRAAASSLRTLIGGREVHVLPNGIDPATWATTSIRRNSTLTIVSVLRMARRKRPFALLHMLDQIRRSVPAAQRLRAVLIGSGPLDSAVRRRLQASGSGNWVTLAGNRQRSEVRDLLHRADLYLAPATLESFGIAALEARSAGVPVIGMARGGIGEFVHDGLDGFLVDSDAHLVAQAAQLLGDRDQLRRMQAHNRSHPPTITWPSVLAQHQSCYVLAGASWVTGEVVASPTTSAARTETEFSRR